MIAIVDYKAGNLTSVQRALEFLGHRSEITDRADHLTKVLAAVGDYVDVILRDTADFPRFNEVFRDMLDGEKVTRTCVGGTPHRTGVNVEID